MELKRCKNGHSYDPSITPECPECAALAGHTVPLVGVTRDDYNFNTGVDFPVPDPIGKTQPVRGDTLPVNPQPSKWADADDYKTAGHVSEQYNPTMPVGYENTNQVIRPVTGWLVCVEGAEKGRDYRLHSEMNYIGRSKSNDVVLSSDPTVSRERHALIAYDNREKMFFFAPANGSSLVRQNGRPVLSTVELKSGDRLEIGSGVYLFIPLCGEAFVW